MADTEHRQSVPTEKGKDFQKALLDGHEKKIKSSCFMLKDTLSKLEQLPASLKALQTEESNLNTVFQRFEKISNEYLDFLSRCPLENAQDYTEQYWPIFQELKSKVCKLVDRIQLAKDNCDTESSKSRQTRRSIKTDNSNASQLALQTQAKVESEKVKLKFLEKELTLKKEKFDKECEIKVLEQLKTVAAAEAEASVINERPSQADKNEFETELPKETITPFEKTLNFLRDISYTKAENDNKLSAEAPVFYPTSTPHVKQQARHTSTLPHTFDRGNQNVVDPSNYLLKKNLLLESMQRQLFDDKPEQYLVWKAQFLRMTTEIDCSPLEEITLLSSCINRNANAYRLVMSARASCADQPENCLDLIWSRLDKRFGSPELIESVLKSRIMKLPDSLDYQRLYELSDLLVEIQAVKVLPAYSSIFAYLDSSLGLKQIIQKLPRHIQDKWINRVVNYKKQHGVLYPPFEEFVDFIGEISSIRNDPGLNFGSSKESTNFRGKTQLSNNMKLKQVASLKTEVVTKAGNDKLLCIIHPGSKHTINQCNAFRGKSFHDRREILKSKNVCYRCCETTSHFAKKCEAKIQCNVCKSDRHCTALHISQESTKPKQDLPSAQIHGEEVTGTILVKAKCTEVCGKFRGKSCARIVPVRVYKKGQSDNFVDCFAMLDDQSNKSLGKGALFDSLGIHSNSVQYTMQSCSGTCVTNGRLAEELVEGSDNVQIHLPPASVSKS